MHIHRIQCFHDTDFTEELVNPVNYEVREFDESGHLQLFDITNPKVNGYLGSFDSWNELFDHIEYFHKMKNNIGED